MEETKTDEVDGGYYQETNLGEDELDIDFLDQEVEEEDLDDEE